MFSKWIFYCYFFACQINGKDKRNRFWSFTRCNWGIFNCFASKLRLRFLVVCRWCSCDVWCNIQFKLHVCKCMCKKKLDRCNFVVNLIMAGSLNSSHDGEKMKLSLIMCTKGNLCAIMCKLTEGRAHATNSLFNISFVRSKVLYKSTLLQLRLR